MAERRMPTEEDFPSNANGVEKLKGEVVRTPIEMKGKVRHKHSIMKSVRDEFVNEDAPSIGEYILLDIFFPALRDMISDMGHSTIDIMMGNSRGRYSRGYDYDRRRRSDSYVSYNRMYEDRRPIRSRRDRDDDDRYYTRRRGRDLDDLIFEVRRDAESCLTSLLDILEEYGQVSVSDLYDILDETVYGDFTKTDWGWEDLSTARIRKVRDGYLLDLPRVRPLS